MSKKAEEFFKEREPLFVKNDGADGRSGKGLAPFVSRHAMVQVHKYYTELAQAFADQEVKKAVMLALDEEVPNIVRGILKKEGFENKWISVEERLPPVHKYVLVYRPSYGTEAYQGWQIDIATLEQDGKFEDSCWRSQEDITHWQPLPEPPKQ